MDDLFAEITKACEVFSKLPEEEQDKILYPDGKITFYTGTFGDINAKPLFSINADGLNDFVKNKKG